MRTLIIATASAIALGIAGASPIYADDNGALAPGAPSATQTPDTGSVPSTTAPQAGTMQQSPSMTGNTQSNNTDMSGTSQSSMDWPRVSSNDVQQVQQKLEQDGLYHGKIDGLVGPETQRAIRAYQHQNGLPVTATLDPRTMDSLGLGGGMGSSTPPASSPSSAGDMNTTAPTNAGSNGATGQPPAMNH